MAETVLCHDCLGSTTESRFNSIGFSAQLETKESTALVTAILLMTGGKQHLLFS